MKLAVSKQAKAAGASFAAMAVSLDWTIKDGLAFLEPLGEFDEAVLGGNWGNSAALRYIWSDTTLAPMIPQVVILERTVDPSSERIRFGPERVIFRVTNASAIRNWARKGSQVSLIPRGQQPGDPARPD